MSESISGRDAWIAKSDHKDVDWKLQGLDWQELTDSEFMGWDTSRFLGQTKYMFRLKPRTITINNIEVPAPFEPKDGDEFWILFESHYSPCGYKLVLPDSQYSELCYGAWRTEDEIKQVVAALKKIFVINNQ